MIYEITTGTLDVARAVALTAALPSGLLVDPATNQQQLMVKLVEGVRLVVMANHGFTMSNANLSSIIDACDTFTSAPPSLIDPDVIRADYTLDGGQVVEGALPSVAGESTTPIGG